MVVHAPLFESMRGRGAAPKRKTGPAPSCKCGDCTAIVWLIESLGRGPLQPIRATRHGTRRRPVTRTPSYPLTLSHPWSVIPGLSSLLCHPSLSSLTSLSPGLSPLTSLSPGLSPTHPPSHPLPHSVTHSPPSQSPTHPQSPTHSPTQSPLLSDLSSLCHPSLSSLSHPLPVTHSHPPSQSPTHPLTHSPSVDGTARGGSAPLKIHMRFSMFCIQYAMLRTNKHGWVTEWVTEWVSGWVTEWVSG